MKLLVYGKGLAIAFILNHLQILMTQVSKGFTNMQEFPLLDLDQLRCSNITSWNGMLLVTLMLSEHRACQCFVQSARGPERVLCLPGPCKTFCFRIGRNFSRVHYSLSALGLGAVSPPFGLSAAISQSVVSILLE